MTETCGCCEPSASPTPAEVENRPALSAIAYRIGTYASFRETMLERISRSPELAALTTRRDDDRAIALLDLWAAVGDVLSFYQERYANEAFLRTATEAESVARLARLIDYRPRPGVAALASLAFTVEEGGTVEVSPGLRVQSVPGQDEQPQVFETLEPLRADARLNRLRVVPEPESAKPFAPGSTEALLVPGEAGLRAARALPPGERIVFHGDAGAEQVTVSEVRAEGQGARVVWSPPLQLEWKTPPAVHRAGRSFSLFGRNVPPQTMQPVHDDTVPGKLRWILQQTNYTIEAGSRSVALDATYDDLVEGARLLVVEGETARAVTTRKPTIAQASLKGYSDTVTNLEVAEALPKLDRRTAAIHELLGERIPFWGNEYPDRLRGATVLVPGREVGEGVIEIGATSERLRVGEGVRIELGEIEIGRRVLVGDEDTAPVAARIDEVLAEAVGDQDYIRLELALDTDLDLDPETAFLLGNVAEASHGETVHGEILDSGDGAEFPRVALRRKPLTYLPSTRGDGAEATAEVRVNGVRWRQAESLHGRAAGDEVYVLRQQEDGGTSVQFGDGRRGAKPGSGSATATYRAGSGLAGRVRARTLETPLDRPVGLRDVTNPLPARGGADAESLGAARENAPSTVRTLGRAVSLRDFEDLVRASGEVAKASAISVWDGWERGVHLTVAAQAGMPFEPDDLRRLAAAMRAVRDPHPRLAIANFVPLPIELEATIEVDPDRVTEEVLAAARSAVLAALSFDSLWLAQPLHLSDLYAELQGVEGVLGVDVDRFRPQREADRERPNVDRLADGSPARLQPHIHVYPALPVPDRPGVVIPAELATIEEPSRDVTILAAVGVAS